MLILSLAVNIIGAVFSAILATAVLIITATARQALQASSLGMNIALSQILLQDGMCMLKLSDVHLTDGHATSLR